MIGRVDSPTDYSTAWMPRHHTTVCMLEIFMHSRVAKDIIILGLY